jgi:hypothetical protein
MTNLGKTESSWPDIPTGKSLADGLVTAVPRYRCFSA